MNKKIIIITNLIQKYNTVFVFLIMLLLAFFLTDNFFTQRNILNITRQISTLGVVSLGMLLIILTGGIDLSVGSVMAVSAVFFAYYNQSAGFVSGLLMALSISVMLGATVGGLVSKAHLAPFVATLAMMTIGRGIALNFVQGKPIVIENSPIIDKIGQSSFLDLPIPFYFMLGTYLIVSFILNFTVYGRLIRAIGSNEEAAHFAGINTKAYIFSVYVIAGITTGIGGIMASARSGVGSPVLAEGFELDVIAACVVGGASLTGGKGSAWQTIMGVLILGMISNFMNLRNIPGYNQMIVKGAIIILAVLGQNLNWETLFKKIMLLLFQIKARKGNI